MSIFDIADKRDLKRFNSIVDKIDDLEPKFEEMSNEELQSMTNLFKERLEKGKRFNSIVDKIDDLEPKFEEMSNEELQSMTNLFKERLEKGETLDQILPEAFATVREASRRVLGLRHYRVQLIGGIVLHEGRIAEMKTGEGKTLVATCPVYLNALSGKGVHVVTVNDYLAKRDRDQMAQVAEMKTGEGKTLVATCPVYLNALSGKGVHVVTVNDYLAKRDRDQMAQVYEFLGLSVGVVIHGQSPVERKKQYDCDITYGTNNEFGFDYLKDNMVASLNQKVQSELNYAIVDEVDSILIDEARTPLIISGPGNKPASLYLDADVFVRTLNENDYEKEEKEKVVSLTDTGVEKAEKYFNVRNLADISNTELNHHIHQALKAHVIMKKDIDYVPKDGEIVIVDEFTGRLMFGRRYSEGLHQAIEAKEGLDVQAESVTMATITFQNYFRMYNKLSGMTGTAKTEEDEFKAIYKMDVFQIPTNKPVIRKDLPDVVYKDQKSKFNAVIKEIVERHAIGQPVLVGTASINKSEILSHMLKERGIEHNVLNAKFHEQEAEIVAQAGKLGAVTIATNMAGRGTDIVLGGNPSAMAISEMRRRNFAEPLIQRVNMAEEIAGVVDPEELEVARKVYRELVDNYKKETEIEKEKVLEVGGLCILGTERHESRRIDNQLRGRAGRQGDPGVSKFFLALDDDLMRLFGSDKLSKVAERIGMDDDNQLRGRAGRQGDPGVSKFFLALDDDLMRLFGSDKLSKVAERIGMDDTPVEHRILTKSIANAQKKVEGRNFGIRKSTLEYDDVMNKQRTIIYKERNDVLDGVDVHEQVLDMMREVVNHAVDSNTAEWSEFKLDLYDSFMPPGTLELSNLVQLNQTELKDAIYDIVKLRYKDKEDNLGHDVLREYERAVLLQSVDRNWIEHIDIMDQLRQSIGLRAWGQQDPVIAYKMEGFKLFDEMNLKIRFETVRELLNAVIITRTV